MLHNLDPFLQYLGEYVPEVQAFFANFTAATQAHGNEHEHRRGGPQAALPDADARAQPGEPRDLPAAHRHRPRATPTSSPGAFSALGDGGLQVFSNEHLRELRARRSAARRAKRSPTALIEQIIGFKVANAPETPERDPGAGLQPAGTVHVQRPDQPVPARRLRWEMMSDDDDYQYHSDELDLSATRTQGDWSIRCTDVHKRLGGVPVLNGLNVAIPDDTITVVLGPSGTGKSVLIKHLIGLMFPDSGDIVVHGAIGAEPDDAQAAGAAPRIGVLFQDGALFGSMSVFDNVAFPLRQHTDHDRGGDRRARHQRLTDVGLARRDGRRRPRSSRAGCASAPASRARS